MRRRGAVHRPVSGRRFGGLVPVSREPIDFHERPRVEKLQQPLPRRGAFPRGNRIGQLLELILHVHTLLPPIE